MASVHHPAMLASNCDAIVISQTARRCVRNILCLRRTTFQETSTSISSSPGKVLVNIARCASEDILSIFTSVMTRKFGVDGRKQNG